MPGVVDTHHDIVLNYAESHSAQKASQILLEDDVTIPALGTGREIVCGG